jgi:outer membrane protein TolC
MKRYLLWMLLVHTFLGAEDLSLSQALKQALEADPGLSAARHELAALDQEVKMARSKYLPRLSLKGSYTRLDQPIDIQLDNLRDLIIRLETGGQLADLNQQNLILKGQPLGSAEKAAAGAAIGARLEAMIPSFNIEVLDRDLFRGSLEALMPIWLGGKIGALNRAAGLKRREGEIDYQAQREGVALETVQAYLGVKLMEEICRLAQDAVDAVEGHARRADSLCEAGLVARYQARHAAVALSDARVRLGRAKEGLGVARSLLGRLMGLDNLADITLTTPITLRPLELDPQVYWARIRAQNPLLGKVAVKGELVAAKRRADLAEWLPQIVGFAKLEILRDDLSLLDPKWAAGVSLSLNLFSGGEKLFRLKADRQMARVVDDKARELERLLSSALDKLLGGARAEMVSIEGFAARLGEAEDSIRLAESRFSSGMGISLEVVDARLMKQKIQTEYWQAVYLHTLYGLKIHELARDTDRFVKQLEEQS